METIIEILQDLQPAVDYATCTTLIDDHYLDSLTIISLVTTLEDTFDIVIPAVEIVPSHFNSAFALWEMVQRLIDED